MPSYEITIATKDVANFEQSVSELYPEMIVHYARLLIFARKYELDIPEEDYLYLSLKFKFFIPKVVIIKPKTVTKIRFLP